MFDVNIPAGLPVIIAVLALQGCGHKGPLVLPPSLSTSQVPTSTVPAASQPVPDPQKPSPPASLPDKQP